MATIWDKIKEIIEGSNASMTIVAGHGGDITIDLLFDSELIEKEGIKVLFLTKEESLQLMESLIGLFPDEAEEIKGR